jgi:hypothetical protein
MRHVIKARIGAGFAALLTLRARIRPRKRVLIHEILSLQIIIIAFIGTLPIAGLYWGGQWVLQDNYSRWALQWTEELNELGAPLTCRSMPRYFSAWKVSSTSILK